MSPGCISGADIGLIVFACLMIVSVVAFAAVCINEDRQHARITKALLEWRMTWADPTALIASVPFEAQPDPDDAA